MTDPVYDIAIIGGGINGAGIARDAAGRGLKVILIEKNDLGSATSSNSSKLIHGGLRYLEQKQFRLVRESLKEREILLKQAPHIIRPLRFILPHIETMRPHFLVRLGLLLYDFMAYRKILKRSKSINLKNSPYGKDLIEGYNRGFTYSDCWVDDARLVILNCMDAKSRGAEICPNTECMSARFDGLWNLLVRSNQGKTRPIKARALVNATGPWVNIFKKHSIGLKDPKPLRLVKGSHIVVSKIFEHNHAYILQQSDKRIVFAIPYEKNFTLIGTTEQDFNEDPSMAEISDYELNYLINASNSFFKKKITRSDIIWTYSGVRPLAGSSDENMTSISRDYILEKNPRYPNLLNIYGGKITTYRKLAENSLHKLGFTQKPWTSKASLPGGNIKDFDKYILQLKKNFSWIPEQLLERYARSYGTLTEKFISHTKNIKDLGIHFGDNIYENELNYLTHFEWAQTLDDILWRRSKLGLHISLETKNNINLWLQKNQE